MKALNLIAWASTGIGILLILLAGISTFTGSNIFGFEHRINYFNAANSFFLFTIIIFMYIKRCDSKK